MAHVSGKRVEQIARSLSGHQLNALYDTSASPGRVDAHTNTMTSLARLGLVAYHGFARPHERFAHRWAITRRGVEVRRAARAIESSRMISDYRF